ncbi:Gfo/Idh/MocA family protein [Cribrihabitans neustonicus]|uniref:Gfo/Idh/MocA family protein n=1 Tax=Cribrihabitans neustonicus TaxID=1429085 RepID=UPI003B594AFE
MHWGLIGASTIAAEHMTGAIRPQDGHEVKSVLSSNAERGAAFAREHGIAGSTTSLHEMLADRGVGTVCISTTVEKHLPQAMAAIAEGKHVICDKPLAMSAADAASIVGAAQEAGVVLATNHHLRIAGSYLEMKKLIQGGELGEVLSVRNFHAVLLPEHLRG